jgi:hypothetical protein
MREKIRRTAPVLFAVAAIAALSIAAGALVSGASGAGTKTCANATTTVHNKNWTSSTVETQHAQCDSAGSGGATTTTGTVNGGGHPK